MRFSTPSSTGARTRRHPVITTDKLIRTTDMDTMLAAVIVTAVVTGFLALGCVVTLALGIPPVFGAMLVMGVGGFFISQMG